MTTPLPIFTRSLVALRAEWDEAPVAARGGSVPLTLVCPQVRYWLLGKYVLRTPLVARGATEGRSRNRPAAVKGACHGTQDD